MEMEINMKEVGKIISVMDKELIGLVKVKISKKIFLNVI